MSSLLRKYWFLTLGALLFFASASLAQTTTMTLTGVGNGATVGDVYVNPYTATIGSTTGVSVICDDWSDNTYDPETWTANVNAVSSLTSTTSPAPLFGDNPKLYNEAAWLASQLMANSGNQTLQDEISFALWQLTWGQNGTKEENPGPLDYLANTLGSTSAIYYGAEEYFDAARGGTWTINGVTYNYGQGEGSYNASGWVIYTPTGPGTCSTGTTCGTPQEFLVDPTVTAPESSPAILLGVDMLGLLALVFVFRRRLVRPIQ